MNFEWFFERIFVNLGGLDLGEIVLDVDEVFVRDDGNHELFVVLEKGKAEEGCGWLNIWSGLHRI